MARHDSYETLDVRVDDHLCWLTLNRPDSLNAMSRQLVSDLREFLAALPKRQDIRVVILKGAGRGFCAGLDLKEALAMSLDAGSLEQVIAMEDRNQVLCIQSPDIIEGMRAFLEKRPPRYTD